MSEQRYPLGWDEDRVRQVIAHYEDQSEDEQFAEIEAAREAEDITLIAVPKELVPGGSGLARPKSDGLRKRRR